MGVSAKGNATFVTSSFWILGASSVATFCCSCGCSSGLESGAGAGVEGALSLTLRFFTCTGGGSVSMLAPLFLGLLRLFSG